ncbi:MAG: hypothetical protein JW803_08045 [Endomicrobiales bacterium]|nr:hypothetical protein [Endomicrobiales bacterium]
MNAFLKKTIFFSISFCMCAQFLCADFRVYPRMITPGSPPDNETVFFEFEDFDDPKPELKIYDINGREVKMIPVSPSAISLGWRLVWDGRDEDGNLVPPGVYIYQWKKASKSVTGTIVIVR